MGEDSDYWIPGDGGEGSERAFAAQRRRENRASRYNDVGSVPVLGALAVAGVAAGIVLVTRWCARRYA